MLEPDKHCFAGQALVEAYSESRAIQMCAVITTNDATKAFHEVHMSGATFTPKLESFFIQYLIPFVNGSEAKRYVLNWLVQEDRAKQIFEKPSLRSLVLQKFWEHGKDIGKDVDPKVDNTIKSMEFLRTIHCGSRERG